jgi:hypothetical protein
LHSPGTTKDIQRPITFFPARKSLAKATDLCVVGETRVSCLKEMVDVGWVEVNKRDAEGGLL